MLYEFTELLGRLLMATLLGGVVGLQRERGNRPAGFRTHMLVSIGSALITILSDSYPQSDGRIAAQIVSGIGFLGAGTIIREGASVKGLTTAASLWAVAGVGMAVGHSTYTMWLAAFATAVIYLILSAGKLLEDYLDHREQNRYMTVLCEPSATPGILNLIQERSMRGEIVGGGEIEDGQWRIRLRLRLGPRPHRNAVLQSVLGVPGVRSATWDFPSGSLNAG